MNVSGNTTKVTPFAAASATCNAALFIVCSRSSTTGGCCTTATLNMACPSASAGGCSQRIGASAFDPCSEAGECSTGRLDGSQRLQREADGCGLLLCSVN